MRTFEKNLQNRRFQSSINEEYERGFKAGKRAALRESIVDDDPAAIAVRKAKQAGIKLEVTAADDTNIEVSGKALVALIGVVLEDNGTESYNTDGSIVALEDDIMYEFKVGYKKSKNMLTKSVFNKSYTDSDIEDLSDQLTVMAQDIKDDLKQFNKLLSIL